MSKIVQFMNHIVLAGRHGHMIHQQRMIKSIILIAMCNFAQHEVKNVTYDWWNNAKMLCQCESAEMKCATNKMTVHNNKMK